MRAFIHALMALLIFLLMLAYLIFAITSKDYPEKSYHMLWAIWALLMSKNYEHK